MSTITLTFAESGENHIGNEIIGSIAEEGYSVEDLVEVQQRFPDRSELYDLTQLHDLEGYDNNGKLEPAYLLVVRNPFNCADDIYGRLVTDEEHFGVNWDKKAYMKGRICNKLARHNLLFADLGPHFKRFPDYENKKGTIYNYNYMPELKYLYDEISKFPNTTSFIIEGNYYYDISKTYIKGHGDKERRKVVGYRLGQSFPLHFQWFHRFKAVTHKETFILNHGDLYMMSSKAVGNDWGCSSQYTLRHSAGLNNVLEKLEKPKK